MHHTANHKPYDLTTEHGRAQSYAHSPHGAYLVRLVEQVEQNTHDTVTEDVGKAIAAAQAKIDWDCLQGDELLEQFAQFRQELGVRDAAEFLPMYTAYSEERQRVRKAAEDLTELVNQIRKLLDIAGEPL